MAAAFIAQPFYLSQPDWKMNGRPAKTGGPQENALINAPDPRHGPAAPGRACAYIGE